MSKIEIVTKTKYYVDAATMHLHVLELKKTLTL